MPRLPHLATLLRPSTVTDSYGDSVDGALAPVGAPFRAWLQQRSSLAQTANADAGAPVVATFVLYALPTSTAVVADDVIEVDGVRYAVDGEPRLLVNPRGRGRFREIPLKRVTRGG